MTQSFIPALLKAAQIAVGHRVLDFATGTGVAAQAVVEIVGPSGEVVAGDISSTMLPVDNRNLEHTPIQFEKFYGQSLPYQDGCFDRAP